MSNRGLFLVLEGVEGVGKTTQWERISDAFRAAGHTLLSLREPGGTPAGDAIRHIVLTADHRVSARTEALLFAASRAEIIAQVIEPALDRGKTVLLDRFLLSTYAYQGAGREVDMRELRHMNSFATRGIVPDLTLLLTLPLDTALQRAAARSAFDRIEREDRAFHDRVARAFINAADASWQRAHPECGPIVLVDASGTEAEVTQRCLAQLAERWPLQFEELLRNAGSAAPIGIQA